MAEVLLRVVDVTSPDIYKDVRLLKRGMVVEIMPDGWNWSHAERTAPYWRIIALPGVPVDTVRYLTRTEHSQVLNDDPSRYEEESRYPMRRCRAWRFNLDKLTGQARNTLNAQRSGNGVITVQKSVIDAVLERLPALTDPGVIG